MSSGKGSAPRNCFSEAFRSGWERIFGGEARVEDTQQSETAPAVAGSEGSSLTSTFVKPSENVNEYEHEIDWAND